MTSENDLFSDVDDLALVSSLLADLHDELRGKVARYRQLADLSTALGEGGTMMPGGEVVFTVWLEARTSFIHGNYIATILLCQSLAENMLAAHLELGIYAEALPDRVRFDETLKRCVAKGILTSQDAIDFQRLVGLRNPLSHYKGIGHPSNLSRRAMSSGVSADQHLRADASFAISMAVRLLSLDQFRLDGETILDY